MINLRLVFIFGFGLLLSCKNSLGQLAEIKPFDTSSNEKAKSSRLYADAVKENILGNSKEAEALFTRFIEAEPNVAAAYYELARINAKENNVLKANQNIKKAMSLDSTNKWYLEFYGNLLASTNKFAEAAAIFTKLADKYSPNEDYLFKSSLLYQRNKDYGLAILELEKLVKQRGPDEEVLMQINQLYLKENKIDEAAKTLGRIIEANPNEARFRALLAEMYLNNKNITKAKEVYDNAERIFPDDISIQLGLASYYKQKGDTLKYTEYVNKSITNKAIDEQTQITLLISYLQDMGKDSNARINALKLTEKLLMINPQNSSLNGIYGDLLSMSGHNMEAISAYKKALKIDANNINVWQQLLFNLTDKSNADSLIFYSEEALSLFPSSAMIHYLNGIGNVNKGNYKKGIKAIETAISFQPSDKKELLAEMYASLGDAYNSNKEFEQADKSFNEALKLTPDNATVLNNYAYYLSVRKVRLEEAEKYSEKSLQLRPGEATFLDTYGWIFYQQGKYERAKELIAEAIQKNGVDADATLYEHLGDIFFKLNKLPDALLNWGKALEKDPNNEELQRKIKDKRINE
ncbi:MAG: tetratricopeptide repeat protein [Bacteroidota bacterium]